MRDDQKRDFARTLRRDSTDVERVIWRLLRDRRLGGLKFRRQVPVGPFIVDFACVSKRLVIELDGGQHGSSDRGRDAYIASRGWLMLRFWNSDVIKSREAVLMRIAETASIDLGVDER